MPSAKLIRKNRTVTVSNVVSSSELVCVGEAVNLAERKIGVARTPLNRLIIDEMDGEKVGKIGDFARK